MTNIEQEGINLISKHILCSSRWSMNIKAEERDSDESNLKNQVEWIKASDGGCCNEDSADDSDDELVYATGFPPPPPGKRLAPVGQEVDAEEVRDGKAPQVSCESCDMIGFVHPSFFMVLGKRFKSFPRGLSVIEETFSFCKTSAHKLLMALARNW